MSRPSDRVLGTPPLNASAVPHNLLAQHRARIRSIVRLSKLRQKARAEIDRLIAFLDASDPYVMTEREDDDEREEGGDIEPSLGLLDHMTNQERNREGLRQDLEDEQDGAEPPEDREPSLGSLDAVTNQDRLAVQPRPVV